MKKIAVANLKGGVGKSTTTMFLAEHWALRGKRVLVIDLDPQANASFMLLSRQGVQKCETAERTTHHLFVQRIWGPHKPAMAYVETKATDLKELRAASAGGVSIVPSVPRLWFDEYEFDQQKYRANSDPVQARLQILGQFLSELQNQFDAVIFDCPPGFSTLTRSALIMADKILCPTIADHISIRSLGDFIDVGLRGLFGDKAQAKLHIVVSKFTGTSDQKVELDRLRQRYDVVGGPIPLRDQVVKATLRLNGEIRTYAQKYERPVYSKISTHVKPMTDAFYKRTFEG